MSDLSNKLTITIIGRSGCGKGTQAKFIVKRLKSLGVKCLETGKFLRNILKKDNPTVEIAKRIMERGELIPSWLAAYTWLKNLIEKGSASYNIVFDGSPRKVWEAELLDEVIGWHSRHLPICIYLDVSREETYNRLMARKRADDNPEAISRRLDYFEVDVLPTVAYYQSKDRIIVINGEQSPKKVWKEIDEKLAQKLGEAWPVKS